MNGDAAEIARYFREKYRASYPLSLENVPVQWQEKDMQDLLKQGARHPDIITLIDFALSEEFYGLPIKSSQDFKYRYNEVAAHYSRKERPRTDYKKQKEIEEKEAADRRVQAEIDRTRSLIKSYGG